MAIVKVEIRPKGDGSYADVVHPQTSADMVLIDDVGGNFVSNDVEGALEELKPKKGTATIPITGWETVSGDYTNQVAVPIASVTADDFVKVIIDKDAHDIAQDAEICPTCESYAGGIYIYAKNIPAVAIAFSYVIIK